MPSDLSRSQAIPSARQACEVGLLFSPFHGRGRYVTNPIFEVRRRWQGGLKSPLRKRRLLLALASPLVLGRPEMAP